MRINKRLHQGIKKFSKNISDWESALLPKNESIKAVLNI